VDQTQRSIVRCLERAGCLVWLVNGALDAVVSRAGQVYLLEFKTSSAGLTARQKAMIGAGWPVKVVRNEDEALCAVGLAGSA
jgi:hypothetical protein